MVSYFAWDKPSSGVVYVTPSPFLVSESICVQIYKVVLVNILSMNVSLLLTVWHGQDVRIMS